MTEAPVPDPNDAEAYQRRLAGSWLKDPPKLQAPIEIGEYDQSWPVLFAREAARLRSLLGERIVRLEHVGSTSVPGLPAKPVIDIVLEVPDSSDEGAYAADLDAAGYPLTIRELYAQTKRKLAARDWTYVQQYADAKTSIIVEIMARAAGFPPGS